MSEFKGTKGKWEVEKSEIDSSGRGLYRVRSYNVPSYVELSANAKLIADAGNVRQKINVDLPELLKQRDELLEMLKEAKRVICLMKLSMWVHPDCSEGSEFYDIATTGEETEDKIEQLIKEATTI